MTYRGRVVGNTVVFDEPTDLPDGTVVRIEALNPPKPEGQSLLERLGDIVGSVDDLPEDYALNHRHYRFGHPKQ